MATGQHFTSPTVTDEQHKAQGGMAVLVLCFGVSWPLEGASRWLIALSPLLTFELLLQPPPTTQPTHDNWPALCTASFVINFDGRHVALSWSSASTCDSPPGTGPGAAGRTRWQRQQLSKLFAGRLIRRRGQSFSECRVPGAFPNFRVF